MILLRKRPIEEIKKQQWFIVFQTYFNNLRSLEVSFPLSDSGTYFLQFSARTEYFKNLFFVKSLCKLTVGFTALKGSVNFLWISSYQVFLKFVE